jgi:ketosteroid isomerase-like protein
MKNHLAFSILAVAVVFFVADRLEGQCRNGMCPTSTPTYEKPSAPVNGTVSGMKNMTELEKKIVQIEKDALDKWYEGNPSPYIANMDAEIGYFEPVLDKRLDGKESLQRMFEALRGKVHADKYDMLNTRVQASDKMAVLTFNLLAVEDGVPFRWNCTEVYGLEKDGQWKLLHSHWSETNPPRHYR